MNTAIDIMKAESWRQYHDVMKEMDGEVRDGGSQQEQKQRLNLKFYTNCANGQILAFVKFQFNLDHRFGFGFIPILKKQKGLLNLPKNQV